jgi:hypothetical protein
MCMSIVWYSTVHYTALHITTHHYTARMVIITDQQEWHSTFTELVSSADPGLLWVFWPSAALLRPAEKHATCPAYNTAHHTIPYK